jgi:hypothetical protein
MSEPKPFASLSSGLLARKGAAKPAMRPQGFGQMGVSMEDLGWNDMGHPTASAPLNVVEDEPREHVPSSIAALTPAPRNASETPAGEEQVAPPVVVEQQRAIEARLAAPEAPAKPLAREAEVVALAPRPKAPAAQVKSVPAKAKAAFTLRLDEQRHLKLRLACAVSRRSAQNIVTEALDEYLSSLPELEALAGQVPAKLGKR